MKQYTFLFLIFFSITTLKAQSKDTITTKSGLKYFLTKQGNGKAVDTNHVVIQHYTVWLSNGDVLDSSRDRNNYFASKLDELIKGYTEALSIMKVGDRGIFILPYYLAYGEKGVGSIPPKETLTFDIEIIDVKKYFLKDLLLDVLFDSTFKKDSIPKTSLTLDKYHTLKKEGFSDVYVDQYQLNTVGYKLIKKFPKDALEILKQNVIEYPDKANPYDSLGECYMKLGNNELAIVNFKKALEIDPKKANSSKMLKQLERK